MRGEILLRPEGHQQILKSTALAQLHDHEETIAADAVVDVSDDVGMAEDLEGVYLLDVLLVIERLLYGHWLEVLFFFGLYDAIASPYCAELAASKRLLAVDYVVAVSFVLTHSYYKEAENH